MSGFHDVRFPDNIAYGATGGPEFATTVVVTGAGHEQRNVNWAEARGRWDVGSGLKNQAQLDELIAFFRARKGRAYGFRFKDWTDHKATRQLLGTGDGAQTQFQLVKRYPSGSVIEVRTVSKPVAGTVRIYKDTVEQLSGWSVNVTTGLITFTTAPAAAVGSLPITSSTCRCGSRPTTWRSRSRPSACTAGSRSRSSSSGPDVKTISSGLAQHLAGEVTTLATCWKITRRDGVVLGFTDHVRDLEVNGITYQAASGYTRTAIRGTADLAVDDLDVESVFSDGGFTEEDLRTGRYDFADVRRFLVNYENLTQGILKLRRGWLEVTIRDGMYVAELRGMTQKLQMTVGEIYTPDCAADLGDARCGVDLTALEVSGTVTAVTSAGMFETSLVQATGWYDGGELTWSGGANAGQTVAVRSWSAATSMLTLFLPALYPMQAGDAFTIRPGCDKTFATCQAKFDNVNFRGFPHVPGNDQVLSYPDAQS